MANKIIDKNKINKEPKSDQTAQDKGVGSTDLKQDTRKTFTIRKILFFMFLLSIQMPYSFKSEIIVVTSANWAFLFYALIIYLITK